MRRTWVLLLAVVLLLASATALAEPGRGRGKGVLPMGAFQVEEGSRSASGDHLSFSYNETGLQNFSAADRALFDVRVEGEGEQEREGPRGRDRHGIQVEGAQLRVRTASYSFVAHDTPTAASKLQTDGTIHLAFKEGVVLARESDERVRFSFGDVTGMLRGEDLVTAGRNVTASDVVLVLLDKPRGSGDQEHYREVGRAIGRGHVGAEATLNLEDEAGVVQNVVSYGNVTMTTEKAERGNLTVVIEGHGFEGRVIVLNVDGRILGAESAEKLNILLDNETVRPASNLTDILDPDDDGYRPEYYLVFDPQLEAFQLIVTLPHYSVHILSVTTPIVLPPPSVMLGVLLGLALLVPAGAVLFRRR